MATIHVRGRGHLNRAVLACLTPHRHPAPLGLWYIQAWGADPGTRERETLTAQVLGDAPLPTLSCTRMCIQEPAWSRVGMSLPYPGLDERFILVPIKSNHDAQY